MGNEHLAQQMKQLQDRLLNLDKRNPAVLLRKIIKRRNYDLVLDSELPRDILTKILRGSQNAVIQRDSDTSQAGDAKRSHLRTLAREVTRIEEETGVTDLAVGFPFVRGHGGPFYFRAPLLLWPVSLEMRKGQRNAGWHLTISEGEGPRVNRALFAGLRKMVGIELSETFHQDLEQLLEADVDADQDIVNHLLRGLNRLLAEHDVPIDGLEPGDFTPIDDFTAKDEAGFEKQVLRLVSHCVLGLFPQGSEAIYQDYEGLVHWSETHNQGFGAIGEMLGVDDPSPDHASDWDGSEPNLDRTPDKNLGLVLPSDGSQDAAVLVAQQAPVSVVRGPPGTGKSQVITNLISDGLNRGECVLVVCQKRAALDVVYERLQEVGMDDIALLVHDPHSDRADLYKKLAKVINIEQPESLDFSSSQSASQSIDSNVAALNSLVKPLWSCHRGYRIKQLYSLANPAYKPIDGIDAALFEMDRDALEELLESGALYIEESRRFDHQTIWRFRSSLAKATHVDEREMKDAMQTFIQALGGRFFVLPEHIHQQGAIRAFERAENKPGLFGKGRKEYKKALRYVQDTLARFRVPSQHQGQFLKDLRAGQAVLEKFDSLAVWLKSDTASSVKDQIGRDKARVAKFFQQFLDAFAEFHAVIQFDRDMATLTPEARRFLRQTSAHFTADDFEQRGKVHQEFLHRWIREAESRHPELSGDPFSKYTNLQECLRTSLKQKRRLLAKELRNRVLQDARSPTLPPGLHHGNRRPETDWNRLRTRFELKKRIPPIRKLYHDEQFQHIWPKIGKVWLMSPEAVSSIFPLDRGMFDVVIFDEASQLAIERGLPAMHRGKRVVIAGDEKQLRPFDLFRLATDEEEEDLDEDTKAAESLLQLARATYTPRYLSWHYRSRYQELIDFSNHAYYEGRLQIAASSDCSRTPLVWHAVNGTWEKQQNVVEAEKIVDVLHDVLRNDEGLTVGIVTFNAKQRDLILDRIDVRTQGDADFAERWLLATNPDSGRLDDRPFVKNAENVQGDERDIIIMSPAYAPGPDGKVRYNFGRLNTDIGVNILNVVVTRAKHQVHIVCSLDPAKLPATTTNPGPVHFKKYLQYGKAISEGDQSQVKALIEDLNPGFLRDGNEERSVVFDSPLEEEIYDYIKSLGYHVDTQVGYSSYRLDLAVATQAEPDRYIAAVECDGAAFHSAQSARERDMARQDFLEMHGWTVLRVWSRDWFYGQEKAKERIKTDLERLATRRALYLAE